MNFKNLPLEIKEKILIDTEDVFLAIEMNLYYAAKVIIEKSFYLDQNLSYFCLSENKNIFFEWVNKNIKNEDILTEICYIIVLSGNEDGLFYFKEHVNKIHVELLAYSSSFKQNYIFLNIINFISNFSEDCSFSMFESALLTEDINLTKWLIVNKNKKLNEYNTMLVKFENTNMVGISLRNGMPEILNILIRNTNYTPMPDDYLIASQNFTSKTSLCFKILEEWMME